MTSLPEHIVKELCTSYLRKEEELLKKVIKEKFAVELDKTNAHNMQLLFKQGDDTRYEVRWKGKLIGKVVRKFPVYNMFDDNMKLEITATFIHSQNQTV